MQFNTRDLKTLQLQGSSKGNQRKWFSIEKNIFVKEQFYYQDKYWKDYMVEAIASEIGLQMELFEIEVLQQKICKIIDRNAVTYGVYSPLFGNGKRFLSYHRLLGLNNRVFQEIDSIENKWNNVLRDIEEITGLNYENYLLIMSIIDYLVGNEDRHLNNFGVLIDENGKYSIPPLFDFGLGLFEHDRIYEGLPFRECIENMQCKPFSLQNQEVIDYLQTRYDLKKFFKGGKIDLSNCEIPSLKAGSYLRNRCMHLGIELKGVE